MGELHLEILVERLVREFKVQARVGRPQVAYRETITRTVEAEEEFIAQRGAHTSPRAGQAEAVPAGQGEVSSGSSMRSGKQGSCDLRQESGDWST